ncbi:mRNA-binding protein PUF3 [Aspergillus puulaauensis]|uniref:mRNA binding protein puf3 n=1 Tax=Aspergillus puulaauensis TaxID=1220207 RepID=A0A7R7XAW4_9EURO|nr:mRNA binding protein puf3 [Aspergillus puulaauensis]BCS17865.1 mRNA binding protein puf3 [Aspergillus puulaauensis]
MTVIAGHSRKAQSNGSNMQPSSFAERTRGTHGSIGSGLSGNPNWSMSTLWKDSLDDSAGHPTLQGVSGSSSLLASSESDGWNAHRNVPWPSRGQGNGMTTSSVQTRSTDHSIAAMSNGNDASNYFAQPTSGSGPSPGTGQMTYLDSGPERISPAGEANVMGSRPVYRNNDRRNAGYAAAPVTAGYQTQSGYASPLDSTRPEHIASINIPSVSQALSEGMEPRNTRNGYAHSSHNSASFVPQRPAHSAFPSYHSETQFSGRYGSESANVNAAIERLQLNETHSAVNRPPYVSHASLDSSINRLRYQSLNDQDGYQAMQNIGAEGPAHNHGMTYQTGRSPHFRESDLVPSTEYPLDSSYNAAGPNSGGPYRSTLRNNSPDGQIAGLQGRLRNNRSMETSYQVPNVMARQQQFSPGYDYGYQPQTALATMYPVAQAVALANRQPPRDLSTNQATISPRMADFRVQQKTRKFELKEAYGHIVEFSGDQYGSRFLQQRLETANSDEKEHVYQEIIPEILPLAMDIFGNYVVQKMFEHGSQAQKKSLASQMKGNFFTLSVNPYGCRVVQKALEHVLTDQQISLVKELEPRVVECVENNNGNHVIQKAIEKVPSQYTKFVVRAFRGQVEKQAKHTYGCRVIQRMLENCEEEDRRSILSELHACAPRLIEDQYGNYVIQHVIQQGDEGDRAAMIDVVKRKLLWHSKHKFASNVVEKSIDYGNETQRREIIAKLATEAGGGDDHLIGLMADQYGNYVFQKVLGHLKGVERAALVERIKPLLPQLKKSNNNCSKQLAAIEKFIGESSPAPNPAVPASNHASTTPPNSHKSSPQPIKRSVEDRFITTPPTPPPADNQGNGENTASLSASASAEVTPTLH